MKSLRGKVSNLSTICKLSACGSCLSQIEMADNLVSPISMGLRLFSSKGRGCMNRASDHRNGDNDNYFGRERENHNAQRNIPPNPIPGRPLRDGRRLPPFQQPDNNYKRRVRNDNNQFSSRQRLNKPVGRGGSSGPRRGDDFSLFDDDEQGKEEVGFEGDAGKKRDSQPSISDFLRKGIQGDQEKSEESSDFLERFKLKGADNKESDADKTPSSPPQENAVEEPPQDADVIFKKMKESGLIPNAVAMLDELCKDGLVQEALKLFSLMREKGTMPEVVIYTAVIDGFCQAQKFDDAKRIFRKMQNNGIIPNAYSYSVLIRGLCKGKRLDDAVDFCVEMLEAGHSPNVTTFAGLVDELCQQEGVEEAKSVIDSLKQKGFYLDDKAVRAHLDKKGPSSPLVWDAIFGSKKTAERLF